MTTKITVQSHNYPALVQTYDLVFEPVVGEPVGTMSQSLKLVEERILKPEDGVLTTYCTTTRQVHVTDVEYDDPRLKP